MLLGRSPGYEHSPIGEKHGGMIPPRGEHGTRRDLTTRRRIAELNGNHFIVVIFAHTTDEQQAPVA
jgi:hypothetical protein